MKGAHRLTIRPGTVRAPEGADAKLGLLSVMSVVEVFGGNERGLRTLQEAGGYFAQPSSAPAAGARPTCPGNRKTHHLLCMLVRAEPQIGINLTQTWDRLSLRRSFVRSWSLNSPLDEVRVHYRPVVSLSRRLAYAGPIMRLKVKC